MTRRLFALLPAVAVAAAGKRSESFEECPEPATQKANEFVGTWDAWAKEQRDGILDAQHRLWKRVLRMWKRLVPCE